MSTSEKPLHIDIPVKLTEEKVVFSVDALAFEGDLPASIFHLQLVVSDIAEWNAKAQAVAVFHTNAGHVTLHDGAYNADRNVATGNPYKELLSCTSVAVLFVNNPIYVQLIGMPTFGLTMTATMPATVEPAAVVFAAVESVTVEPSPWNPRKRSPPNPP
jgi:hypothetical protein